MTATTAFLTGTENNGRCPIRPNYDYPVRACPDSFPTGLERISMMRRITIFLSALALVALTATSAAAANKPGAHWLSEPVCTYNSDHTSITCTAGSVAGVGSVALTFIATTTGGCTTSGNESSPPGHLQSSPQTLTPKGGRIDIPSVNFTVNCPPGLNASLGPEVIYTLSNGATIVFQASVIAT
jgi:hypothetical protein